MSALETLDLNGTQVANVEPLKGLTALRELNLNSTQVANLEPLRGLTALETLELRFLREPGESFSDVILRMASAS